MMFALRSSRPLGQRLLLFRARSSPSSSRLLVGKTSWKAATTGGGCLSSVARPLSSAAEAAEAPPPKEEKPLIPGVGKGKTSTGLVGLAVEPDWYNVMLKKFQALLDKMEDSDMPETAQYRIDVTKWCNYVIKTVKANPEDPEAVEDAVNMGQVEELIEMADDEMVAMEAYLSVRMWEEVEKAHAKIDFDPNPMTDPMAEGQDPDVAERIREGMKEFGGSQSWGKDHGFTED